MNINSVVRLSDSLFRRAIFESHDGKCFYTGRKIGERDMHIDHILPQALGGKDEVCNLVPTTSSINISKGKRTGEEMERMIYINQTVFVPKILKIMESKTSRTCWYCGKDFLTGGNGNYCSRDCRRGHENMATSTIIQDIMKKNISDDWNDEMIKMYEKRFSHEMAKLIQDELNDYTNPGWSE